MIRSNTIPVGRSLTRFTIVIGTCNIYIKAKTFFPLLLPLFSSRKDLTVVSVFEDRLARHPPEHFSLSPFAAM